MAQRVVDGKRYGEETLLLFVVENVADLLKLKRKNFLSVFILRAKQKERFCVKGPAIGDYFSNKLLA